MHAGDCKWCGERCSEHHNPQDAKSPGQNSVPAEDRADAEKEEVRRGGDSDGEGYTDHYEKLLTVANFSNWQEENSVSNIFRVLSVRRVLTLIYCDSNDV